MRSPQGAPLFGLLMGITVISQLISPHFNWHSIGLDPRWGHSLLVAVDFIILLFGFRIYLKAVRHEERARLRAEKHLSDSFKYIGQANRKLEIVSDFVGNISPHETPAGARDRINGLLGELAHGSLGATQAVLRIIDTQGGKTITEWTWQSPTQLAPPRNLKLANRKILSGDLTQDRSTRVFVDSPSGVGTVAVLAAGYDGEIVSDYSRDQFILTMIRFMHVIFSYTKRAPLTRITQERV